MWRASQSVWGRCVTPPSVLCPYAWVAGLLDNTRNCRSGSGSAVRHGPGGCRAAFIAGYGLRPALPCSGVFVGMLSINLRPVPRALDRTRIGRLETLKALRRRLKTCCQPPKDRFTSIGMGPASQKSVLAVRAAPGVPAHGGVFRCSRRQLPGDNHPGRCSPGAAEGPLPPTEVEDVGI